MMPAGVAVEAGHMVVQGHAVARPETVDDVADADDGAGGFVPKMRGGGTVPCWIS